MSTSSLDDAIAAAYRSHVEAKSWSCVALLSCVVMLQQHRPDLPQTQAIKATMEIISRVRWDSIPADFTKGQPRTG